MVVVFSEGILDYSDRGLVKPIKYSRDVLEDCFSSVKDSPLMEEHTKNQLAVIDSFTVRDGDVHCDVPDGVSVDGLGFSPVFSMDLVDKGEFYEPVNMKLMSVGLTKNPRNEVIYNSIKGSKSMSNNNDTALETALKRQRELENERATLENQLESQKSALKKLNSLEKQVKELTKSNEELSSQIEEYSPKVEKYNDYVTTQKEKLLDDICNGSDELRSKYADFSFDNLKTIAETRLISTPPKGVATNITEGLDKNVQPKDGDDEYSIDQFKADYMAAYGEEPTINF